MASTKIIVNADDFGLSFDISDAIIRGYDRGLITSTTLIVNSPAAEHAAGLARLRPKLGVGVHLNITTGRPLIDPARLSGLVTGDGCFLAPDRMPKRLTFDFHLVNAIAEEYSRQVERCLDLGIAPTHCDTHHGMHRYPVVFEAFRRTLLRYRIKAARSQVRLVIQAKPSIARGIDAGLRWDHSVRGAWKRLYRLRMRTSGIRTPDALLHADLNGLGDVTPLEWFDFLLRYSPPGTFEIILHPGIPEGEESASNDFLDIRRRDTALVDQIDRRGERWSARPVRFISYAELARPPG
jgi:chitin disaccharide deacetylase